MTITVVGKATTDMLPMIAVPTTSGTGSEAQSFALISDAATHTKMACGDPRAACRIALLDPVLTVTQPQRVTALTGIDAISHAIETYVTNRRNPMSSHLQSPSVRPLGARLFASAARADRHGGTKQHASLARCLAGMAIETSMLGAAHATANPLTARHDITHGQAVGMMLPAVIRMNGKVHADWYAELVREVDPTIQVDQAPERLAEMVVNWMREAGLATSLDELSIPETGIDVFVEDALKQWTGTFNPIPLDADRTRQLYRSVA